MSWQPVGKLVMVKLHRQQSLLDLSPSAEVVYKTTGDVLAVGPEVVGVAVGDVVLLNGQQGAIGSRELGEDVALVAAPLILAKRGVIES